MESVGRCVLMGEITAHALGSGCAGGWASWLDGSWSGSTLKWGRWVIFLVWQCCWMYSVLRWCHWLAPTSVQAGSQAVSLCSMAGWCHWFDSSVCQNYEVMLCNCSCLSGACLDGVTPCWGGTSGWALQSGRHWLCPLLHEVANWALSSGQAFGWPHSWVRLGTVLCGHVKLLSTALVKRAPGSVPQLGRITCWDLWQAIDMLSNRMGHLCSMARHGHRLFSLAAQGHCLVYLTLWGQRLCSTGWTGWKLSQIKVNSSCL